MSRHIVRILAGWELDADRCQIVSTDLRSSVVIVVLISGQSPRMAAQFVAGQASRIVKIVAY